jgi:hypothetical protein
MGIPGPWAIKEPAGGLTLVKIRYAELKQAYDRLVPENIFLRLELEQLRTAAPGSSSLSTTDKVLLRRLLFRGREDVYAVPFTKSRTGRSGYETALAHHGLKPADGPEDLLPLTDPVIYQHFLSRQTIGLYLRTVACPMITWPANMAAHYPTQRRLSRGRNTFPHSQNATTTHEMAHYLTMRIADYPAR